MNSTTPLAGITTSIPPTRVYRPCIEAFAHVHAASRQRLAGVAWAGRGRALQSWPSDSQGMRQSVASRLGSTHSSAPTGLWPGQMEGRS
jgi:hypothetical protein